MLLRVFEGNGNLAVTEVAAAVAVVLASGSRYVDGYALCVRGWRGLDLSSGRFRGVGGVGGRIDACGEEATGRDE